MGALWQDLRYALRTIRKSPGFTVVAGLALALGIGGNTAIFTVVDSALLRPLPYPEPDRLVALSETNPLQSPDNFELSYANFLDLRAEVRSLVLIEALDPGGATLTGVPEPARIPIARISRGFLGLFGAAPQQGRGFGAGDDRPGAAPVALVSHPAWRLRFGSDPGIVGRSITLDGFAVTVIGVLPAAFRSPTIDAEVWMPLGLTADLPWMKDRSVHLLTVFARLAPGADLSEARAEVRTIAERLQRAHPGEDTGHTVALVSAHERAVGNSRPALLALLGAVSFVLLIACANVASMLLARTAARGREIAIRSALGAGRGRVIRQLLTESLLLSLLGGAAGLLLAVWGLDLLAPMLPEDVPRIGEIALSGRALAFTFAISMAAGALFGMAPALQAAGSRFTEALKQGRTAGGAASHRARRTLVAAEVALTLVLVVGAGLMIRSLGRLAGVDPGFRPEGLLSMSVSLPPSSRYDEVPEVVAFYKGIQETLEAVPGVRAASAVSALPISGDEAHGELAIEGRPFPPGEAPAASFRRILPGYFRTMGTPLTRGREFGHQDMGQDPKVVIINEGMARRFWADGDPIGSRIKVGPPEGEPWLTVVGVVGDVRNVGLDQEPSLATYEPHAQRPWRTMNVIVRADADPAPLAAVVRDRIRSAESDAPIDAAITMTERAAASMSARRFNALLMRAFAAAALLLAALGVYGVMASTVNDRTREIGVRVALGARASDVRGLVLRQGLGLTLGGLAVGVAAAITLMRLMTALLFEISPADPLTYAGASALIVLAALAGCYLPARRAAGVDPAVALRCE